jgi:hypothetical protein
MAITLYSKEYLKYNLTHMCPECGKFFLMPEFLDASGSKISAWDVDKIARKSSLQSLRKYFSSREDDGEVAMATDLSKIIAICPKCKEQWPVFSGGKVPDTSEQQVPLVTNIEIKETHRSEEEIGSEQRIIDNSQSGIELERRFTVSKDWAQTISLEEETGKTSGAEISVGISEVADIKASAEQKLKNRYTQTEQTRQTYAEEIILKVPGNTKLMVEFNWKRIWQHGDIIMNNDAGETLNFPFKVIVGITFDQTQIDQV